MSRKFDDVMASFSKARRQRVEARASEQTTIKALRQATQQTQGQNRNGIAANAESDQQLSSLSGGLESSISFTADPLTIQRQMRDEWH